MAWSKEWSNLSEEDETKIKKFKEAVVASVTVAEGVFEDAALYGVGFSQAGKHVPLKKVYSNKMPTHDPYTNPDAHIYYQCACGDILDPGTKSFAALNNATSDAGWKVRWGSETYVPYCVECGKDIE